MPLNNKPEFTPILARPSLETSLLGRAPIKTSHIEVFPLPKYPTINDY